MQPPSTELVDAPLFELEPEPEAPAPTLRLVVDGEPLPRRPRPTVPHSRQALWAELIKLIRRYGLPAPDQIQLLPRMFGSRKAEAPHVVIRVDSPESARAWCDHFGSATERVAVDELTNAHGIDWHGWHMIVRSYTTAWGVGEGR